jgi:hypothetical protein
MAMGWWSLAAGAALGADILLRAKSMRPTRTRAAAPAKRPIEGNAAESDKSSR